MKMQDLHYMKMLISTSLKIGQFQGPLLQQLTWM